MLRQDKTRQHKMIRPDVARQDKMTAMGQDLTTRLNKMTREDKTTNEQTTQEKNKNKHNTGQK